MEKEEMKQGTLDDIKGFFMHLVYLKDIISVLEDIQYSKEEMQIAANFTLIVESALKDSYNLILMRMYDNSKQTMTIPNLISKCKNNIDWFPSPETALNKLNEFEDKINNDEYISPAIKTLKIRRDTSLVHNDKKFFGANINKDNTTLKQYHIWFLVDFTEEVLNYLYEQLFGQCEKPFKTKYNKDLHKLFK